MDPLERIHGDYLALKAEINELPQRFQEASTNFESEFLLGYRIHIKSLQSELKSLHEKIQKAQDAIRDDETVSKLERSVEWFSLECQEQQTLNQKMRDEINRLLNRSATLTESRSTARLSLINSMKRCNFVNATSSYEIDTELLSSETSSPTNHAKLNESRSTHFIPKKSEPILKHCKTKLPEIHSQNKQKAVSITTISNEGFSDHRTPTERALCAALLKVNDDITQRRMKSSKSLPQMNSNQLGVNEIVNSRSRPLEKSQINGISGFNLISFTATDKYNAIVMYLSDVNEFLKVIDKYKEWSKD